MDIASIDAATLARLLPEADYNPRDIDSMIRDTDGARPTRTRRVSERGSRRTARRTAIAASAGS